MNEKSDGLNFTKVLILNTAIVLLVLLSITGIFSPLYSLIDILTRNVRGSILSVGEGMTEITDTIGNLSQIKRERDELQAKVVALEGENAKLEELRTTNETLEKQLGSSFSTEHVLIAARIIRLNLKEEGLATIDKGKKDNVAEGDILILENYALGEVVKAREHTSEILLITSPESQIPVISQGHDVRGILSGSAGQELTVGNILQTDVVDAEENFVTLGINSNYPAGLLVGNVSEITSVQTETKKSALLSSPIEFDELRLVFILKKQQ